MESISFLCALFALSLGAQLGFSADNQNNNGVQLILTPDQQTNEDDLVFTIVSGLSVPEDAQAFLYQRQSMMKLTSLLSPISQWQERFSAQYLGAMLDTVEGPDGYEWKGDLTIYLGEASSDNEGKTRAFPQTQSKDRSYHQMLASASSFKLVEGLGLPANLRVYYAPMKTDWTPPAKEQLVDVDLSDPTVAVGKYKEDPSILILYVDPSSGDKKAAVYGSQGFYGLRTRVKNPLDQTMASIWYTLQPGAVDFSYLEAAEEKRGIPVNLFTTQVFLFNNRSEGGYIYGANEGDPVAQPDASDEQAEVLEPLLQHAQGKQAEDASLRQAVESLIPMIQGLAGN